MYATLIKTVLATALANEGKKQTDKDKNDTGRDDAIGKSEKAIAAAINSIDFETVKPETFRNIANAFRAAADQLDAAADSL